MICFLVSIWCPSLTCFQLCFALLGPAPTGTGTIALDPNFWKFYVIRTDFTLSKLVSLVKMFRLFRLEWIFWGVQSVDTVGRFTIYYLLAGPACLWCDALFCLLFSLLSHRLTHVWFCDVTSQSCSNMIHMRILTRFCWDVSFISLWETTSVSIIIYHLCRSLKRGQKVQ
jgi:hypothetical protein